MGATAIGSPYRCRCVFCVFCVVVIVVPTTPWQLGGCFGCVRVFYERFWEHWCVCVECIFSLSNIVNYRKNFIFVYKLRLRNHQPNSGRNPRLGKNIGQQYCWCSLMWLMPLRSLSNCDYELKNLPRLILGPIHSNQVMGTDPVGSYHGTRNSRSNSINPTYPYQSHD